MKIYTDLLADTLNLHVSGQVGEWPANQPDHAPANPESDKWWNMKGWIANEVWINGMDRSTDPSRYRFKNASARELQLSKERFGTGTWLIRMKIKAIQGKDGRYNADFPEGEDFYSMKVY